LLENADSQCFLVNDVPMHAADGKWVFEFSVKFYPPEPSILQEELTRLVDVTQKLGHYIFAL